MTCQYIYRELEHMVDIFNEGMPVTLMAVLNNKEWRVDQQRELIARYANKVIVAVKLNVPGKIKSNRYISRLFQAGWKELLANYAEQQVITDMIYVDRLTGPEGFIVIDDDVNTVKQQAIKFEINFKAGRLFDVDVMGGNGKGKQLSRTDLGFDPRKCFVCDQPAKVCARSQKHDINTMKSAINALCNEYFEVNEYA